MGVTVMITTFTLTAKKQLMTLFRCAHCGETNVQQIELAVQRRYDDKAFTQKGRDRQREKNTARLTARIDRIANRLEQGAGLLTYPQAKLKCRCKKCSAKQPFASMNFTWWFMGVGLVLVYLMGMGLALMSGKANLRHLYNIRTMYLPIGLAVLAALLLGMGIHFLVQALRHRAATENAPVLFARSVTELKKKAAEVESYRDADYSEFE